MYRWEGKVESDPELILMAKTRSSLVQPISEFVLSAHPYDLPEVIAVPITGGLQAYMDWVENETQQIEDKTK